MSVFFRHSGLRAAWRQRRSRWDRRLNQKLALDRWFPHVPIALATLPAGLLMIELASARALGTAAHSLRLAEIERNADLLGLSPPLEAALGITLVTISIGLFARSRLAWILAVAAGTFGLFLPFPPWHGDLRLFTYKVFLLLALLVFRRRFRSRSVVTAGVFMSSLFLSFLVWATLGTLRLGAHFDPPITTLADAFYFTFVSISSVGFGDIVPRTPAARLFVVAMIFSGVLVIATGLSAAVAPLVVNHLRKLTKGSSKMDRINHYVVVGSSSLAGNAAEELERRGQRVTRIVGEQPSDDFYSKWDVVVGDATDLSVLREANTERAKGVLALTDDDATNGFVVLGVNEIDATITTVAALNDAKNEFRVKRTQPSMVLSLHTLGAELLAMALTGEQIHLDMLREALQLPAPTAKA